MPILKVINYDALLRNALYWGDDFDDVLNKYERYLRNLRTVEDTNHANSVMEYHQSCNNKVLQKTLRKLFKELNALIPDNVLIYGRRKSFISYEAKIRKYIAEGKNLDGIKDLFGFRIVLLENNTISSIKRIYKMAEEVIEFFTEKGLTVCELKTDIEKFDAGKFPELIVPRKSFLQEAYKPYVKDYIFHPKSNGYQSLHLLFKTKNGVFFEIQLRNLFQHVWNEEEAGAWSSYKVRKYKNFPKFNPKRILIPGLVVSSKGKVFDTTGLIKAKYILHRTP